MTETIILCAAQALAEDSPLRIHPPGGEPMMLCRHRGAVHALSDTCSHGMASLSEGDVEDGKIFCPFHGGSFDLATGQPVDKPCTLPIKRFAVEERQGMVVLLKDA
jgi:nitrite reductase/ring-hydroxylating ferredoxin subunit